MSRWRGAGIGFAHDVFVDAGDAEVHREIGLLVELLENVDVAHDERALRDDARWHRVVDECFETPSRQLVFALDRLIRIGRGTDRQRTIAPTMQFLAQDVGDVHAYFDVAIEVTADIFLAITRVISPRKTVDTLVGAARPWIEAPIEWHAFHSVERALHFDLAVGDRAHRTPSHPL